MSTRTSRHVVLGGGPAGRTTARTLADGGDGGGVRLVDRRSSHASPGVESVVADLSDPDAARAAVAGADVVYHCVNVAYHLQVEVMPGLGRTITDAAAREGAQLVVLDTLYPYGEADGDAITEDTPWAATSAKGRMRADLDRYYLDRHRAGDVEVALGRSADFFGPEVLNSTLGAAFFPAALTGGRAMAMGDTALPHSYSYLPDIAAGLAVLGRDDGATGRVWHLPTVPAVSTDEVHRIVAGLIDPEIVVDVLSEPVATGPFDEQFMAEYAEMFYQHLIAQNMVSSAFEGRFDVHPTALPDALAATLDWYRGWVADQGHDAARASGPGPGTAAPATR